MDRAGEMVERQEEGAAGAALPAPAVAEAGCRHGQGSAPAAPGAALQHCEVLQNMIDISISNLRGLRTQCAASNNLTQREIRTVEEKLVKYISRQLQCKLHVPENERTAALKSYPRVCDWLYTIGVGQETVKTVPEALTIDALLDMNESRVKETMRRYGASSEECLRINDALISLRKVARSGGDIKEDALWSPSDARRESGSTPPAELPYSMGLAQTHAKTNHHQPRSVSTTYLLTIPHASPQLVRRDFELSVTHRFSTKSWLTKVCQVCQKSMMFGVKCKHCKLKCHNKCTKEAPACIITFHPSHPMAKIRRTESVPSDINNPAERTAEPQFGTLPKALTKKDHTPVINHLDSSSNPSSTTSSTPSSPAPFQSSNPSSATTPPNPSPMGLRDNRFNFPDAPSSPLIITPPEPAEDPSVDEQVETDLVEEQDAEVAEQEANKSEAEEDEEDDELDELPPSNSHYRRKISRNASQTSVYLQEWDIPFEQIELGELIGQGRWGKVYRGKWHGEVAIRLLEIDGNNQDHLKLFKKEVMNYRQTRHENVVLFMGACMHPPHLAIITSFCKGRTLHSVVRDPKTSLDINKTRQIAQEIIKGMGYLHAKGIVHKDLKSKNVFYENGKVIITDFGLFGISGVVQEGRRENELKLPHDWLCYLAPEIVREMAPGKDEDKLPFSRAADVYAFGTVWYELQARDWPFHNQAAEALIWQIGSGEGVKQVLATINLGKEVTEILSVCWAFDFGERPSFTLLMDMLEKLPKLNRRLSHPGHFWKSAEL
ncbi:hypothetical protein NDU88_002156 [Pleurodeles waltl]|uniref:non-specific serine/threonine protein kinase n=1 Tax=Pleurodeles waltl TaxID=8319 RepID=A0AAV7UCC3_PLEWA|nr:hypothetical protein NDU88_002156 [Pleurodeles waltl]